MTGCRTAAKRRKVGHMQQMRKHLCAICGDEKAAGGLWFLLAENRWEDKLKILQWDPQLARQEGIRRACSAAHVQELVVHWMTTGSLISFCPSLLRRQTYTGIRWGMAGKGRC